MDRNARQAGRSDAEGQEWQSQRADQPPTTNHLDVRFIEEPHWGLTLKAPKSTASGTAHQRVLTLSQYAGITRHESHADSALARKMAWALMRARAATNSLGLA